MSRKFSEKKLMIASNNQGKVKEIAKLLAPYGLEVVSAKDYNISEPEETEDSFTGNAELKARYYGEIANLPTLADDSGICVTELNNEPGVYSARLAGPEGNFYKAMDIIQNKLKDKNLASSHAYFICALSLRWPDGYIATFEGKIDGDISFPARGDFGFGYDPIFIPKGYSQTFAEFDPELKNKISHRARAFEQLIKNCFEE